ncbi:MAG: ActS/PrrB/RegB family redox-sensitive histidine kinase [Alphaproteobacteria bacterium]|nr:ActS/PrrB/RegB family redox-sensitive histidine kinase [Alphaproteobacteria bacterium]
MTVLAEGSRTPGAKAQTRLWQGDRHAPGQVRLQTLVVIRWMAVAGQLGALLFLSFGLEFDVPMALALAAVGASALLNVIVSLRYPASTRLKDAEAALFLTYDTLQLAVLLYLTGGITNPFVVLFLAPVTVSATVLSLRATLWVGLVVVVCVSVVAFFHEPLPWRPEELNLPTLYLFGQWSAISVAVVFFSIYLWRVSAEARRLSDALVETQLTLAREQRLSALGGLAAAAAHELGTPLSTIAMAAKEMAREIPAGQPLRDDADLIGREVRRCREILGRIAQRPEGVSETSLQRISLASLLREASAAHQRDGVTLEIIAPEGPPEVARRPEIVHGLTNFVENAVDFARTRVTIRAEVRDRDIRIQVLDDGPGMPHDVLGALGEPYVSSREDGEGLGLGVFIAKTLLERTGAALNISNRTTGGAQFEIIWPREALSTETKP